MIISWAFQHWEVCSDQNTWVETKVSRQRFSHSAKWKQVSLIGLLNDFKCLYDYRNNMGQTGKDK